MKRLRRLLASLLMIAIVSSPAGGFAAEGLFFMPAGIREIESEAFSDIPMPNGVFIPDSCTSIAPDAFSNPETLEIYGFTGSEAERYAADAGAVFHSVGIKNASVLGPAWASPDRSVSFSADFECEEAAAVAFEISKDGELIFKSEPSREASFAYAFLIVLTSSVDSILSTFQIFPIFSPIQKATAIAYRGFLQNLYYILHKQ